MILEYDGGADSWMHQLKYLLKVGGYHTRVLLVWMPVPDCREHRLLNCIEYARGNAPNSFLISALHESPQTVPIDEETEAYAIFFSKKISISPKNATTVGNPRDEPYPTYLYSVPYFSLHLKHGITPPIK